MRAGSAEGLNAKEMLRSPAASARLHWWLGLLDPEGGPRGWGVAETAAMALWCGVVGFAVWQHMPWTDEAQAWMLAGSVSWKTLFTHSLHYEGTGGLWHAFLKVLQALHVSFTAMRWIVTGVEGAGVAVLLRWSPFPRVLRLVLPFTFFLLFQDAVVARSYCLMAVLAFGAAALLRSWRPRPVYFALVLGLLANLSVHAAVLAGGLAAVGLLRWRRSGRGRLVVAGAILLLFWVGMAATLAPAFDIDYEAGNNLRRSFAKTAGALGVHVGAPPSLVGLWTAGLPPPKLPPTPAPLRRWKRLRRALSVMTYPLSESRLLALLLLGCVVAQATLRDRDREPAGDAAGWVGLLPYGLMLLVFTSLYLAPHHVGTVLTGFVVTAWLTWPARAVGARLVLARVTAGLFLLVCGSQIGWSAHAVYEEHRLPYSPDRMTAEYLKSLGTGSRVAGYYYFSVGPLLYFDRNIYFNQPQQRYWSWSTSERTYSTVQATLAQRPDAVVIGGFERGPDAEITRDWQPNDPSAAGVVLNDGFHITQFYERNGYRVTHVFCGHSWMRSRYAETLCETVLEPVKGR